MQGKGAVMEFRQKKLLLDTNVVLDYIGRREVGYEKARLLMLGGRVGEFSLWITTSQVTDIIFILTEGGKKSKIPEVLKQLRTLRRYVNVYTVAVKDIDAMLMTTSDDPEDALLIEAALQLDVDAVITRDEDFPGRNLVNTFDCPGFFKWMEDKYGISYAEVAV